MSDSNWGADAPSWHKIPSPFVPIEEDLALLRNACPPQLLAANASPRILVLGVTPALVSAPWPAASEIHAVDYDQAMIDALWVPRGGAQCHYAHWQEMPFDDASFDLVVGDCSFGALPGVADYGAVLKEIARVSRPGAPLVTRFFMQQDPRLELLTLPEAFGSDFAHFSPAAMRLLVAIAASHGDGALHFPEVTERIEREWGPVDEYFAAVGQADDNLGRAKRTFTLDQHLNYPARREIVARFEPFYPEICFAFPSYDCGAFCPIVGFYPAV